MGLLHVYVAASSREPERVRRAMDWIGRAPELQLTTDWLSMIEAAGVADAELADDLRQQAVDADLGGIERADVLWLLAPQTISRGAWFEFGFAAGLCRARSGDIALIASGDTRQSIFGATAQEFASDALALAWLERRASQPVDASPLRRSRDRQVLPWQAS